MRSARRQTLVIISAKDFCTPNKARTFAQINQNLNVASVGRHMSRIYKENFSFVACLSGEVSFQVYAQKLAHIIQRLQKPLYASWLLCKMETLGVVCSARIETFE